MKKDAEAKVERWGARDELACLVDGIWLRDGSALGAHYDATIGRVYGLALRITRRHEAAEEVVEDVYLHAWNKAATFDPTRGPALAWLLVICRGRAIDALRSQDTAELHPEPATLLTNDMSTEGDPQDLLLAVERDGRLHGVLRELSAVQRRILALAFFKGVSHLEVANHTGLPLGTIKSHLRRAMEKMRSELSEFEIVARQN